MSVAPLLTDLGSGPVEYRLDRRGDATVVLFHGGHMRADLALGEEALADAGYTVLAPSRPGYGRTPVSTGRTPAGFADATRELCERLDITRLTAVVGASAGGPTALALATRHPGFVDRIVLQSAVGPLPWPGRRTRIAARIAFSAATEQVTWAMLRTVLRIAPDAVLRTLLEEMSTRPAREVVAALSAGDHADLVDLFGRMRFGRGFGNDLAQPPEPADGVTHPTLVIASRRDGTVPFAHAEALVAAIPHATLLESSADSHLIRTVAFIADTPAR